VYICLCNAITVRHVEHAAACGARRPREVYEAAGGQADCGTCTGAVLCLLRKVLAQAESGPEMLAAAD
jgi:bacterioferritin-associated ferredoxin